MDRQTDRQRDMLFTIGCICASMSVYLSVCLPACLPVCPSVSVRLFVHLSVFCLSVSVCASLRVHWMFCKLMHHHSLDKLLVLKCSSRHQGDWTQWDSGVCQGGAGRPAVHWSLGRLDAQCAGRSSTSSRSATDTVLHAMRVLQCVKAELEGVQGLDFCLCQYGNCFCCCALYMLGCAALS